MDWTDNVLFRGDVDQAAYEAAEKLVGILVRWSTQNPTQEEVSLRSKGSSVCDLWLC